MKNEKPLKGRAAQKSPAEAVVLMRKSALKNFRALVKGKLLGAKDRILCGFGDAEFHDALGLDLDGFAGLGVASHAGGAVFQYELADAGQREGVLRVLIGERGEVVEDFASLLL